MRRARRIGRAGPWLLAAALPFLPYLLFLLLSLLFPFPWEKLERPPAVVVADRAGAPLRFFLPADERWRLPVRLAELPPELPRALVAAEDRWFWRHPGVNPFAAARAAWTSLRAGRVVSGASTLPMQVARMAEPGPRTLASKLRESFRALQLERRFGKREVLELYLNLAPYGGNVEGAGAAAWFHFGKSPDRLSLGEVALLVALPRAPNRFDPAAAPAAARAARDGVLRRLAARGVFTEAEIADALRQPLPSARRAPPFAAPHFAELAVARYPATPRLATTLDAGLQRAAEEQVRRRLGELRRQGIGNAAVVVLENHTRAVRALVGSGGFFDRHYQGQVDGAVARRSPGSALKPFLYAMALDEGRVLPDSYLLDIPTDYSGYVAENYDERYRGRVTVREALVQSLNACAVRLLAEVGLPRFQDLLVRGGLATLDREPLAYGLPLVLGAGEVTLLDLTNLYATLAEGGLHRPARLLETPARAEEPRPEALFSRATAQVIVEILADVRRPDLPDSWALARDAPGVAWKTGTSYGHRDAWAIGLSGRYAIGVWVGNFDGTPRQGISGSQHAGPLLFDLFRAVDPGGRAPRPLDAGLERIELCALSRELPGPACRERVSAPYLPGRSRLRACSYHREALVDAESGELLAGDCLASRPSRAALLTLYPPELAAWWRAQGRPAAEPPRARAGCGGVPVGEPPAIVSPDPATPYRVRRGVPAEDQRIPLLARAGPGVGRLFWYRDGLLVGAAPPGERLYLPPAAGTHRLVVTDDLGRSDGVTFRVE
ncbi:MAG TPA: penicillin-binding protein 1C [Thermoanaerobaculia bacterium]|nr:penicillin-binding protein 1C [Thermoanaerobaculia bacterium]